jgi:hypothetical protein
VLSKNSADSNSGVGTLLILYNYGTNSTQYESRPNKRWWDKHPLLREQPWIADNAVLIVTVIFYDV